MLIAAEWPVGPSLAQCELTHLAREPIDVARATTQHEAYDHLLSSLGATILGVSAAPELPDAVFIEDTARSPSSPAPGRRRAESEAVA